MPVNAKVRYTTLIILPEDERILDFTCGDKDHWIVDGNENFAFVKPAKADAATNVLGAAIWIYARSSSVVPLTGERAILHGLRGQPLSGRRDSYSPQGCQHTLDGGNDEAWLLSGNHVSSAVS